MQPLLTVLKKANNRFYHKSADTSNEVNWQKVPKLRSKAWNISHTNCKSEFGPYLWECRFHAYLPQILHICLKLIV